MCFPDALGHWDVLKHCGMIARVTIYIYIYILNIRFTKPLRLIGSLQASRNTAPADKSEKTATPEPLGAQIGCCGAPGRSKSLPPEPMGAQIGCSGATGRSNWLLRSHWALKSVVLEPLGAQICYFGASRLRKQHVVRSLQALSSDSFISDQVV